MIFKEEKRDLFSVDDKYYLAHCISDDFALGAGIAVEFVKRYNMRAELKNQYPNGIGGVGCVLIDNVFNLITKEKCYHKPTYKTLEKSLELMCDIIVKKDIKYLAIPKIGCGIDRLDWEQVKEIIKEVFNNVDIEILVCHID